MTETVAIGTLEKQFLTPPNAEALLDEFRSSKSFRSLYKKAMAFYFSPHSAKELADFVPRLYGACFEEFSLIYLRYKHKHPEIVLPPQGVQGVVTFYQKNLFPGARTVVHTLDRNSLAEISVPDIIVTNPQDKIVVIYECTLDPTRDNLNWKFEALQKNKKKFPERFPDTRFAVVVPQDTEFTESKSLEIEVERLPLTDGEFREFLKKDILYGRKVGGKEVTVAGVFDIRDRMKDQMQRHLGLLIHGEDLPYEEAILLFHTFGESNKSYEFPDGQTVYTYESSRHN